MRNRSIKLSKKLAAIILCATMTCGLFTGCGTDAKTTEAPTKTEESTKEKTTKKENASGTGVAEKSETVYVNADANGNVESITVSDWLKNKENYETLTDTTTLNDVKAIKGTDEIKQSGNELSMTADGNDVYYRGSLPADTDLPVSVKITYTLDGKEISKDKLDGATGHLGVHIKYTNNSTYSAKIDGKKKDIHVPFLATTMLLLSNDQANNLEIENGKIVENGDANVVIGYGFPGVNESFGLNDGGVFTDTVDFEADVTDYSPEMMMTFVTSEPFASSDLDEAVDFDTVSESLEEVTDISIKDVNDVHSVEDLQEVVEKANDSFKDLNKGVKKLDNGSAELKDGVKKLQKNYKLFDSNVAILTDSMTSAYDGGAKLKTNMATAATKSKTLAAGAKQVSDGVATLSTSMTGMYKTITTTIAENNTKMEQLKKAMAAATPGSEAYMTYYAQLNQLGGANAALNEIKSSMDKAKLSESLTALATGAKQVSDGSKTLSTGLGQLSTGTNTLVEGLSKLSAGTKKLEAASAKIVDGTNSLYDGSVKLNDGTKTLAKGTSKLSNAFGGNINPLVDTAKGLKDAAKDYTTFTALSDGSKGSVSFIIKTE